MSPQDDWCPLCDQIMDSAGFHATACAAGGDRTRRHNCLRDFVYAKAASAGWRVEREEPGILQDDPQRRPGDLLVSSWPGCPAALDFAVTSPLQADAVAASSAHPLAAAMAYEAHKLLDRDTAEKCQRFGVQLVPVVVEVLGGWGPAAQRAFARLTHSIASRSGLDRSTESAYLYQGLAVRLQRFNAKAMLRRRCSSYVDATALATSETQAALVAEATRTGDDGA